MGTSFGQKKKNGDFSHLFKDYQVEDVITTSSHHFAISIVTNGNNVQRPE
jgi:hypothetical protein